MTLRADVSAGKPQSSIRDAVMVVTLGVLAAACCATPLSDACKPAAEEVCEPSPAAASPQVGNIVPSVHDDCDNVNADRRMDYGVEYANVLWRDLEPTGEPTSELLDGLLNRARGKPPHSHGPRKLALRFQVMNQGDECELPGWSTTPDLKDGFKFSGERGACGTKWSVDWKHAGIRDAHRKALKVVGEWAERNANEIAWIEIGSYGFYGEWHHDEHEATLGFNDRTPSPRQREWRDLLAGIIDDYYCAFPTLPLTIAFDALKAYDDGPENRAKLYEDPVFLKLKAGKAGLMFDCLGASKENADWYNYVPLDIRGKLDGPFLGEFCGGEAGAKDAVLNASEWDTTMKIVSSNRWTHIRNAGVSFMKASTYDPLAPEVRKRIDDLVKTLGDNSGDPRSGLSRLGEDERRICASSPSTR